jgi:2-polyprenyl-6-methoxyphenol hydroxylase-like FAD-dependent oxidoreductase
LERNNEYDKQPRASFYSHPAQHEFIRAGIMDDVKAKSFIADGVSWRYLDHSLIAQMNAAEAPEGFKMVSLPLDSLLPLIGSHLDKQSSAEVLWSHKVTGIGQDENQAWVDVETPSGSQRMSSSYVVGCDGGGSKIRRELFGSNFPGRTWDEQIVATNVYLPNLKKHTPDDWTSSNFMISRDHFPMIAQISNDGLTRVTYGENGGLTYDEMLARQPEKYIEITKAILFQARINSLIQVQGLRSRCTRARRIQHG